MYSNDNRTVITLDAGGTNFAFGAIKGNKFIVEPLVLPSNADELDRCLETMVEGFTRIIDKLDEKPVAISFAFPGPADYPNGIIGGYLPNFPSFRDGVALGPFLEDKFGIPVYINNDADLYAYGEALGGVLPELNEKLAKSGSNKHFNNLLAFTFGTGFGFGFVSKGELHIGDNSCVETFCLRHKHMPRVMVEEGVSIRAVKRVYAEESGSTDITLTPKDIFEIAEGRRAGDVEAAKTAFAMLGEVAGDAMATAVTLIDGVIVIGGGLSAAAKYIKPALLKEMRSKIHTMQGGSLNRVQMAVYDLDNEAEFEAFAKGESRTIKVYGSEREVSYDPQKRIGITFSKIGANAATSVGAYAFALNQLDKK
ncbi:MAG: ROK family protein [Alistipes sp.]|nr:ROK family protein [Alistipes sp.]MBR2331945.1 ROK family protein [Alistipes sp.]MBR2398719.1 ROK family protein [Alistipes sp.]MBR6662009.1 ROK family protein [Alistipes sp.]MBR6672272.1 ROK family protein [Alistipes sp.]